MSETAAKEGWGVIRPGDCKAHYYVDGFSLCRRVGFYSGPLEVLDKPSPDDCAACRKLRTPKPARVTEAQATLLEWIQSGHQPSYTDHVTVGRLQNRGLVAYECRCEDTGQHAWVVTEAGERAVAARKPRPS